jgi:hypothetical protein
MVSGGLELGAWRYFKDNSEEVYIAFLEESFIYPSENLEFFCS